jgi:hypothetical protein
MSSKLTSRTSTLEAARTVYFIVIGLAIKQSLGLFGHVWPSRDIPSAPPWPFWARVIVGTGYLVTVIRFSHGITLLYGHEKEQIENSSLPSASKISELSLFLILLAIPLFLMADNITNLQAYAVWTALMLAADFIYAWRSKVVRVPLRRIFRVLKETDNGYAAHAAFWWMATDAALFLACCSFFIKSSFGTWLAMYSPARELIFAGILILCAVADYWLNWDFYFGGRKDRRTQKFVFVCSPLTNTDDNIYIENISRAQLYCKNLMEWEGAFGQRVTPFASHAFFTYFLNDRVPEDRALGRECALAYLSACDAVYAYVPLDEPRLKTTLNKQSMKWVLNLLRLTAFLDNARVKGLLEKLNKEERSKGMEQEIDEAKKYGLEIKYLRAINPLPDDWERPSWSSVTYEKQKPKRKPCESYFKDASQRKKVYVCTRFRGKELSDSEKTWQEKVAILENNTRLALWHCHELARDTDEAVAPFAPQAFFPYFWRFTDNNGIIEEKRKAWFERSIEILKVCDAVYVYTLDGLPPTEDNCSDGMSEVDITAKKLGLEIQYRKELPLPLEEENEAEKEAKEAEREAEEVQTKATNLGKTAASLKEAADRLEAELGSTHKEVITLRGRAEQAKQDAEQYAPTKEKIIEKAKEKRKDVKKKTWNPAVPKF